MTLTGSQKAIAALVISTIGAIVTALITALPANPNVQLWGGIIAGVLTVLATTLGVYQVQNTPAPGQLTIDGWKQLGQSHTFDAHGLLVPRADDLTEPSLPTQAFTGDAPVAPLAGGGTGQDLS